MHDGTVFCQGCGREAPPLSRSAGRRGVPDKQKRRAIESIEENRLESLLRERPVKIGQCLICTSSYRLAAFDFGLAKVKVARDWTATIASAAISAVAIPLVGFGAVRLPDKTTGIRMYKLRITLCEECLSELAKSVPDPSIHPWFWILWDHGYTTLVSPDAGGHG